MAEMDDDEEIDIPMDEETAQAATKIQSRFRGKKARSNVEKKRVSNWASNLGEDAETAATKVQAIQRKKQAKKEADARKKAQEAEARRKTQEAEAKKQADQQSGAHRRLSEIERSKQAKL